jgi:rifampicin phosphotransferase
MPVPPAAAFTPPSPGAWELERTHITRPLSGFTAEAFPRAMMRGFAEGSRFYGALLDYIEMVVLHRFVYMCYRPVGAPKGAKGPPPKLLFKLLNRIHPELRRRNARAAQTFRDRLWREDMRLWDEEVKPANIREGRSLLNENLAAKSNTELADHLRRAAEFAERTIYWHHRFSAASIIAVGDFLVHATRWTRLGPAELLRTLRGLSPVSAGAVVELEALKQAILSDAEAFRIVMSDDAPQAVLDRLAARPTPVGPALTLYLEIVGWRIVGSYEVSEAHALQHPDLLVKIIRAAVTEDETARRIRFDDSVAALRERVAEEHRAQFDLLLQEAQATYRIRDERNFYGDALGVGVLRRAVLEAAGRLVAEGRLKDADHLMDASIEEMVSLLNGASSPTATELRERALYRYEASLDAAPQTLGLPPSPPPPSSWLPPAAARLQEAINIVLSLMFDVGKEPQTAPTVLKGNAASGGVHDGVARVIAGPAELSKVQLGDVLVTTSTAPTFNVILPLVSAIVTERGGALSHAAIVAREYGLPAVVGCVGATKAITTGSKIRVNGDTGEVWILNKA